eukprot:CAMPEP_0177731338 /NCGR_PEP_ID=MMETSP0484_2-20121128/22497_1 /TAXON_ID=354590 /ORGANISM="Rhodomonas lens, Strain RHODO" /LENGTH=139 /DNA_ID=CAMNT_0019244443 /DNA_START=367 /DNA_END=783 /DNA_ORIENTATION=-
MFQGRGRGQQDSTNPGDDASDQEQQTTKGEKKEIKLDSDAAEQKQPFYPLPEIRRFEKLLQAAVMEEQYEAAAALRDELERLRQGDEVLRLRSSLQNAVVSQRFEEAASFRDQLFAETLRRSTDPQPLDRLLLLDAGGG